MEGGDYRRDGTSTVACRGGHLSEKMAELLEASRASLRRRGGQPAVVQLLRNSTRPGSYQVAMALPTTCTTSGSSSLSDHDFGNFPGSFNAYAFNTRETGSASWALSTGSAPPDVFLGFVIGISASDGKPVVVIDECQ